MGTVAASGQLTRRMLLQRGLASAALLALPSHLRLPPRVAGNGGVDAALLPGPKDVYRDVKRMVGFGQRLPGSDAHNAFIDWLDASFRDAGCQMLPRDEFPFTRWLAESWSFELLEGAGRGVIPVAGYQPYSGSTPPDGVVAPLAYLGAVPPLGLHGDPHDVKDLRATIERVRAQLADWAKAAIAGIPGGVAGRIVLVDTQCAPLTERSFAPLTTYEYDPEVSPLATPDFKRLALSLIPPPAEFAQAGAAGMIVTLDASDAAAAGTYGPYGSPIHGMPGLLVGRETGAKLRRYAEQLPKARLTLTASVKDTSTDQLVGILPGDGSTDELMIVNTHTDGMNAFEENGGIGLVHLARYFSQLPPGRRLKRTLVFSATAGHFAGPALPQTRGFIDRHPDLVARAAASLTLEHLGASEWVDDWRGYHPTGRPEMFVIWHSQTAGITGPVVDSMSADDVRHSIALRPAGDYMIAVGTALNESGVPTVSQITAPNYMVSWADGGHLDKFMPARAAREIRWAADLLTRFDSIPAAQLSAGDSAILRSGAACAPGENTPTCLT